MCITSSHRPEFLWASRESSRPTCSYTTQPLLCSKITAVKHSCQLHARASLPQNRQSSFATLSHACGAQKRLNRLGLGILAPGLVSLPARADVLQEGTTLIQKDAVISVAFTVAVVALGAVTLGVLYLSALTFLDNRAEKQEREQFEKALQDKEARAAAGGKMGSKPKQQQKKKKAKSQGFG